MSGKVNENMAIYQVVTKARIPSIMEVRNIHHYDTGTAELDTAGQQELADKLDAAYKTHLQGVISNRFTVYGYDVRRVDIGDLPTLPYVPTAGSWSGSDIAHQLPPQLCGLVTFKTTTQYPRTSRTYLFGFTEDESTAAGACSTALQTAMGNWASAVIQITLADLTACDKAAVQYGGDPRAVVEANNLEAFFVKSDFATQRRRAYGVGM